MTDNLQTQFPTEGQPAFPVVDTENDNSAASSTEEETTTEETPASRGDETLDEKKPQGDEATKSKGDENFADHPRWKEREEDWKGRFNDQETRHSNSIQQLREEFGGKDKTSSDEPASEIPSWFGGDEAQWHQYKVDQKTLLDNTRTEWEKSQTEKTETEQKAIQDATDYMNTEVSVIENDKTLNPDGIKIDKNKLLKFTMDNELVDTQGRWNYNAAYRLMQAGVKSARADSVQEKKDIAGATITEKNGAETDRPNYTTTEDFNNPANRPW